MSRTIKRKSTLIPLFLGVFLGAAVCAAELFLVAFVLTKSSGLAGNFIEPMVIVLGGMGALAGGYLSARISGEKGMYMGMLCGFLLFVVFFIGGLMLAGEKITMITAIKGLTMLICGAVGGVKGVNKR